VGHKVTARNTANQQLEKWRQGQEIIATLHGQPDGGLGGGIKKFALFNTGTSGPNKDPEKNWMIHLMEETKGSSSEQDGSQTTSSQDTKADPVDIAPMLASI